MKLFCIASLLLAVSTLSYAEPYSQEFDRELEDCESNIEKYYEDQYCNTFENVGDQEDCLKKGRRDVHRKCVSENPYRMEYRRRIEEIKSSIENDFEQDEELMEEQRVALTELSGFASIEEIETAYFPLVGEQTQNIVDAVFLTSTYTEELDDFSNCIGDRVNDANNAPSSEEVRWYIEFIQGIAAQDNRKNEIIRENIRAVEERSLAIEELFYEDLSLIRNFVDREEIQFDYSFYSVKLDEAKRYLANRSRMTNDNVTRLILMLTARQDALLNDEHNIDINSVAAESGVQ